jgi:DNA repair protein RecO (recombination protein O)
MPETDDAIVLRLTEYSESSQIVTLFARGVGLLRLIAKGARRSTKQRFAAGLDLLERGDVRYLPARGDAQLGTLTEWVQRETYAGLRRELVRLQGALYAIELVGQLTEPDDPHPELFDGLARTLAALASERPAAPEIPRFQMTVLKSVGYAPSLEGCVSCGRDVSRSPAVYFSAAGGGLVCRDCEAGYVEKVRLPASVVQTAPTSGKPGEWFALLDYHLTHVAGKRFRTAETLGRILGRNPFQRL